MAATFTASDGKTFTDRQAYRRYEFELRYTFRGRKDEKLIKPPGSIEGQPFDMSDLEGCEVALLDHMDQVQVDGLKKCRVLISASSESVFVRDCVGCDLTIACKQLRTRDCHNCRIYLYSKTEPIIELSDGMEFAPFNAAYPQHAEHMSKAGLDPLCNLWDRVFDFNADGTTHFTLWQQKQGPLPIWQAMGEADACACVVPHTHGGVSPNDATGGGEASTVTKYGAASASATGKQGGGFMQSFSISAMQAHARELLGLQAPPPTSAALAPPKASGADKPRKARIGWDPDRATASSSSSTQGAEPPQPEDAHPPAPNTNTTTNNHTTTSLSSSAPSAAPVQATATTPAPPPLPTPAPTTTTTTANTTTTGGSGSGRPKKAAIGWDPSRLSSASAATTEADALSTAVTVGGDGATSGAASEGIRRGGGGGGDKDSVQADTAATVAEGTGAAATAAATGPPLSTHTQSEAVEGQRFPQSQTMDKPREALADNQQHQQARGSVDDQQPQQQHDGGDVVGGEGKAPSRAPDAVGAVDSTTTSSTAST